MRTIIELPEEQIKNLTLLCEKENISRTEAVRRAVSILLAESNIKPAKKATDAFFGVWKDRPDMDDSVAYQRRLRSEWEGR